MTRRFAEIAFTDTVKQLQSTAGSRSAYARMEAAAAGNDRLGAREAEFLAQRDSFYMASVGGGGWPYVQHRGGPAGFVKVLDPHSLGFADFRGNRQYVSVGNLSVDNRVSLFFMDYPNRRRLKLFGRVKMVAIGDVETLEKLKLSDYPAQVERGIIVTVEGFDWNCPQHITPRFTMSEVGAETAPLKARIAELEAEVAAVTAWISRIKALPGYVAKPGLE